MWLPTVDTSNKCPLATVDDRGNRLWYYKPINSNNNNNKNRKLMSLHPTDYTESLKILSYQIFQCNKFATIHAGRQFPYVRMKRQMFYLLLFQILFIPWFYRWAVHTAPVRIVTTQFWITFALQTAIGFSKHQIHVIFALVGFDGCGRFLRWFKWWSKRWNRAARAACAWLWPECFDHLQQKWSKIHFD